MKQEHYDAIGEVLRGAGTGEFVICPPLAEGQDVPSAEILIDPQDMLMDTDPRRSAAVAYNALVVAGLVRCNGEARARFVAKTIGPGYLLLIDCLWRPPSSGRRHFPGRNSRG